MNYSEQEVDIDGQIAHLMHSNYEELISTQQKASVDLNLTLLIRGKPGEDLEEEHTWLFDTKQSGACTSATMRHTSNQGLWARKRDQALEVERLPTWQSIMS